MLDLGRITVNKMTFYLCCLSMTYAIHHGIKCLMTVDVEHENWLTNIEDKPDGSEVCEVSDTLTPVSTQTCHEKATDVMS